MYRVPYNTCHVQYLVRWTAISAPAAVDVLLVEQEVSELRLPSRIHTVWRTRYTIYHISGTTYWYQVPGTIYLVPYTWYHIPGTMYLIPYIAEVPAADDVLLVEQEVSEQMPMAYTVWRMHSFFRTRYTVAVVD